MTTRPVRPKARAIPLLDIFPIEPRIKMAFLTRASDSAPAATAGIAPEDVLAVRDWRNSDRLTPADKAVLAATDECLAGKSISDAAWAEVAKHVTDPGQQVEFVIAMGNWMMFSLLFRNLRIPLAEGIAIWPPDGLASPAAEA